jgi:hypothetical protein
MTASWEEGFERRQLLSALKNIEDGDVNTVCDCDMCLVLRDIGWLNKQGVTQEGRSELALLALEEIND